MEAHLIVKFSRRTVKKCVHSDVMTTTNTVCRRQQIMGGRSPPAPYWSGSMPSPLRRSFCGDKGSAF
eukprot:SAG31_NODE_4309_length_3368_cov_1.627523_1_plen_67_part_00